MRERLSAGTLSFQLNERALVEVLVFDALGRVVADTVGRSGWPRRFLEGRTDIPLGDIILDEDLPSGIYLARIQVDGTPWATGDSRKRK